MSSYIIILSTIINTPVDLQNLQQGLAGFKEISSWSVDLEDCDKILRICCERDISIKLMSELERLAIDVVVLEVFDEEGKSVKHASPSVLLPHF